MDNFNQRMLNHIRISRLSDWIYVEDQISKFSWWLKNCTIGTTTNRNTHLQSWRINQPKGTKGSTCKGRSSLMWSRYGHYLFVLHLVRHRRESWLHIYVLTLPLIIAPKGLPPPPPKFQPTKKTTTPLSFL